MSVPEQLFGSQEQVAIGTVGLSLGNKGTANKASVKFLSKLTNKKIASLIFIKRFLSNTALIPEI